jgi:predicted neutral ceramidase superfamily lipid hydrolase
MSGFNFVMSEHIPSYKYFLLAIPLTTLFHFLSVLGQENNFYSRKLLSWIPLVALIVVFVLILTKEGSGDSFFSKGNIFSVIGGGFWLTLLFSLLLTYVNLKMRNRRYYI